MSPARNPTPILAELGAHAHALEIIERATAADSFCEDLWRRAMQIEVGMGRSAAALDRYRRLNALLASERKSNQILKPKLWRIASLLG